MSVGNVYENSVSDVLLEKATVKVLIGGHSTAICDS